MPFSGQSRTVISHRELSSKVTSDRKSQDNKIMEKNWAFLRQIFLFNFWLPEGWGQVEVIRGQVIARRSNPLYVSVGIWWWNENIGTI